MTSLADPISFPHGPDWRNRFALAPLTNKQSHADGTLSDDEHDWLVARGHGGFGLVMTCAAYVAPAGQAWSGQLGVAADRHDEGLVRLADSLRATGARSSVQLHHGGRRSDPALHGGPNRCPWYDPDKGAVALSTDEVKQSVEDFVDAAVRAEKAGFDGAEVHGAHGYLVGQFLDGRSNLREDGYGGSLEDRMRFLREILAGIRESTGPQFQLGVRLSPEGFGIPVAEARETTRTVLDDGHLDYVDLSLWDVFMQPRGDAVPEVVEADPAGEGLLIDHFLDLPRGGTQLGVTGSVRSAEAATWCLERGAEGADFVSLGFGAIIHHDFAKRAIADDDFVAEQPPITREHLRAEAVSESFIDYLDEGWKGFVA
ncbi:NADH:flavin oxidoreductase [Nocardioidaceae bacterium]|nr:NADH:flavin oxidoreductase [Nocardioidaceae bacterium]